MENKRFSSDASWQLRAGVPVRVRGWVGASCTGEHLPRPGRTGSYRLAEAASRSCAVQMAALAI